MKRLFTPEVRIALVAIAGIVVLFFGMQFLKGLDLFASEAHYEMKFDNVDGLSVTSPVYANGYKVGTVKSIDYDFDDPAKGISVGIDVDKDMKIPIGTTAEIVSDLMGNVKVNLILTHSGQYLSVGGKIEGRINDGTLGEAKKMIPTIEKMLPKIDSILASVNTLLADPSIKASMHNVERITADLTTTTRQLNTLMSQVNSTVPGMITLTGKLLNNANGMIVNTNGGVTEARCAIRGAKGLMDNLNKKVDEVDLAGTINKVSQTLDHINTLMAKLNSKEGSLGLLMNDPSLYNNLSNTMRSADSLLVNLKAHPKRYVHFSLFGRKDK